VLDRLGAELRHDSAVADSAVADSAVVNSAVLNSAVAPETG
jgi:hypothetical protein